MALLTRPHDLIHQCVSRYERPFATALCYHLHIETPPHRLSHSDYLRRLAIGAAVWPLHARRGLCVVVVVVVVVVWILDLAHWQTRPLSVRYPVYVRASEPGARKPLTRCAAHPQMPLEPLLALLQPGLPPSRAFVNSPTLE